MFKRKDWVFLRKGQGARGEASSSSSEEAESDSGLTSENTGSDLSEEEETEEEAEQEIAEQSSEDDQIHLLSTDLSSEEGNTLNDQIAEWSRAAENGNSIKGRALTCTACMGKKLLLNSTMFAQHVSSGKHKASVSLKQNLDGDDFAFFRFADDCIQNAREDVETHAERLERVKNLSFTDDDASIPGERNKRRRRTRPGKRQRQQKKIQDVARPPK